MVILVGLLFSVPTFASAEVDTGATAWMLTSTALVLLMVPGLAIFYGGLVRSKNVLGTIMHSFVSMGIVTLLWVICGYSIAFGPNALGGWIGWDSSLVFLSGLDNQITDGGIPAYIFSMFQGKFAIIAPAIIAGAFAERVRFKAYCLFITLWVLIVYSPICHWVWADDGFLFNHGPMGAIDFAGGTVVHISAGVSALVAAIFIGSRRSNGALRPNNLVLTMFGVGLLWVGWFGFNAGSSLESGLTTAQALTVTQVAAAAGAIAWILIEGFRDGKPTALGFASGILAGLVAITPAAGVVQVPGAIALGILSSIFCYFGIQLKNKFKYDDTLDAFGIHGIGGIVGAILVVFFIRDSWMDSAVEANGAPWSIWDQLNIQVVATIVSIVYSALLTLVLVYVVNKITPFRSTETEENRGLDQSYHGERGYGMVNPN